MHQPHVKTDLLKLFSTLKIQEKNALHNNKMFSEVKYVKFHFFFKAYKLIGTKCLRMNSLK